MKFKKSLIALAVSAITVLAVASPASAATPAYLPMWEAKKEARKDIRYITEGDPFTLSCWRYSSSKVRCRWTTESYDTTCTGVSQWKKMYYPYLGETDVYYSTVRTASCY